MRPASTRLRGGWHRVLRVQPRNRDNQRTLLAVAGGDDLALFAALEDAFKGVQAQTPFGPLGAVTAEAGGLENRFHVFGVSESFLVRRGREFAQIDLRRQSAAGPEGKNTTMKQWFFEHSLVNFDISSNTTALAGQMLPIRRPVESVQRFNGWLRLSVRGGGTCVPVCVSRHHLHGAPGPYTRAP
jgi:hypothetical protein